jgi:hypothetical protein
MKMYPSTPSVVHICNLQTQSGGVAICRPTKYPPRQLNLISPFSIVFLCLATPRASRSEVPSKSVSALGDRHKGQDAGHCGVSPRQGNSYWRTPRHVHLLATTSWSTSVVHTLL